MSLPISPNRMTSLDSGAVSSHSLGCGDCFHSPSKESSLSEGLVEEEIEDITELDSTSLSEEIPSNDYSITITPEQEQLNPLINPAEEKEEFKVDQNDTSASPKPISLIEENNIPSMVSFQDFLALKKNQSGEEITSEEKPKRKVSIRTLEEVKRGLGSGRIEILEPIEENHC